MQEPQELIFLNHYDNEQSNAQQNIIYIHTDANAPAEVPDTLVDYFDMLLKDLCVFFNGKKKTNEHLSSSLETAAQEFNKIER